MLARMAAVSNHHCDVSLCREVASATQIWRIAIDIAFIMAVPKASSEWQILCVETDLACVIDNQTVEA